MLNNTNNNKYIFGFIGSGISSMFLLNELLKHKKLANKSIFHLFDKNIFPFGLVRNGFAPDNYKTKENLTELFTNTLKNNNNIEYFGNIFINNDILKKISPYYSLIISGNGAQEKKLLNIKNENLMIDGIDMAKWYNGDIIKEDKNIKNIITKNKTNNLVIIGNGNVSLDIVRILFLINENLLYKYGIPEKRIKYIKTLRNKINNIYIIGRNSIDRPSFSKFEFKNFLDHCENFGNFNIRMNDTQIINQNNFYFNKKINYLLNNNVGVGTNSSNGSKKKYIKTVKNINFLFNNSPVGFDGKYLYLKNNFQKKKIESNIVIKSIGRNKQNLVEQNNLIQLPSYKNINEGLVYSKNFCDQIIRQINNKMIKKSNIQNLNSCLKSIFEKERIIYKDNWFKINELEKNEGKKKGKIREKITNKDKIFKLL